MLWYFSTWRYCCCMNASFNSVEFILRIFNHFFQQINCNPSSNVSNQPYSLDTTVHSYSPLSWILRWFFRKKSHKLFPPLKLFLSFFLSLSLSTSCLMQSPRLLIVFNIQCNFNNTHSHWYCYYSLSLYHLLGTSTHATHTLTISFSLSRFSSFHQSLPSNLD